MSTTTEVADKIVHALVFDVVVEVTAQVLEADAPWLRLPVVNQVFRFTLNGLANRIYKELDRAVVFTVIDVETNSQRAAYQKAADALKTETQKPEGTKDNAAIDAARAEFKKRLANLIHLNP